MKPVVLIIQIIGDEKKDGQLQAGKRADKSCLRSK